MPAPEHNQNARKFAKDRAVVLMTVRCLASDYRQWKAKAKEWGQAQQLPDEPKRKRFLSAWVTERLNQ